MSMERSILTIEPVAKNYPTLDKNSSQEVIEKYYEVRDRVVLQNRGFVDASEQRWYDEITRFFDEEGTKDTSEETY